MSEELTKQTARTLHDLARSINEREKNIEKLKEGTIRAASDAVSEALIQGQELIKARSMVPHGLWDDWLAGNCPNVKRRAAYLYMSLAKNVQRVAQIRGATSLRSALAMLEDEQDKPKKEPKEWPAYLDGLHRLSKWLDFEDDHPINTWPDEGIEKAIKLLIPIIDKIGRDKFMQHLNNEAQHG